MTHPFADPFEGASWRGVMRRDAVLPTLAPTVLLHAGPPIVGAVPAPIRHAAIQALLFEGIAIDSDEAARMLMHGEVRLTPAQDHGVATPLAQVVSASMPMAVVGDDAAVAYAPLIEGPPPALRFGTLDPVAQARLTAVSALGLERLDPLLRVHPVSMLPVIAHALGDGDECHGRTVAANAALVASLPMMSPEDQAAIQGNAGFVLPILMATACWHLRRQRGGIAAVGGNGAAFGLRMHGAQTWLTVPARPPMGPRFPGKEANRALGAIGDSAVIDICGLGGQALTQAPQLVGEWQRWLPDDWSARRTGLVDPVSGIVDVARVRQAGRAPLVNLAILDEAGEAGLVGRGFYEPPPELFGNA